MRKDKELKIRISNDRVVTLSELYREYDKAHRDQAELPFEEKIKALVNMQKIALSWGKRKDVIVWKI